MAKKKAPKAPAIKKALRPRKRQTVGGGIIEGLKQAIAWSKGENGEVCVTLVPAPQSMRGSSDQTGA
jgi:hypothetical protein